MKIKNIGGATAIIEHNNKRILFDPWMDDGIFHGAWYHYPPLQISINQIGHLDYIFISHIHEDHCSYGTLEALNRDAEIIIMDRRPNFVANFLKSHNLDFAKVHLIPPKTPTEIAPGMFVDMLEADPSNAISHIIDSSLIVKWDGYTLFNANDCTPHQDSINYINNQYPDLDLALLPYSGGSGYPSCFTNLDDDAKLQEKQRIINLRVQVFVDTVKALQPKWVMPFADQFIVGGSRSHLNTFIAHGTGPHIVVPAIGKEGLEDKILLLNSGQSYDFSNGEKCPDVPYRTYTNKEKQEYINALGSVKYDYEKIAFSNNIAVDRLVNYARFRMWEIQNRNEFFPDYRIYLEFQDWNRTFCIDFQEESINEISWQSALVEPYLKVSGPRSLMIMLLVGHISWNIADAAMFLDYERVPNIYNTEIVVYLNFLKV